MTQPDQSSIDSKVLDELAKEASVALLDGELTFGEIVHLGGLLASKVNQFGHLSGHQKKELVIKSVEIGLTLVVVSLPEDKKVEFQKKVDAAAAFAKETLPAVLDLACDVAKGKIDLKKPEVQKTCMSLISLLFRCAGTPPVEVKELKKEHQKEPQEEQKLPTIQNKDPVFVEVVLEPRPASTVTE
jgi:hypothetical protein